MAASDGKLMLTLGFRDLYEVLGVPPKAHFAALKKAYYRRAKECHPDTNAGATDREDEFKLLVYAFDVLSDPQKRTDYDEHLRLSAAEQAPPQMRAAFSYSPLASSSIMDSLADDILEEIVVGNRVPRSATLQNLMRDLENTTNFIRFREGKDHFFRRRFGKALELFTESVAATPENILYHYYLARAAAELRRWSLAEQHYRLALDLGLARNPPQMLARLHRELSELGQKRHGLLGHLTRLFAPPPPRDNRSSEDRMIEETSRSMARLLREGHGTSVSRQLPPGRGDTRRLPPGSP